VTRPALSVGIAAAAIGGAIGAVARWGISDAFATSTGSFPWATFAINLVGCTLLAALPAVPAIRRSAVLPVFLGTGVLGGFTTMSSASEQTFVLLDGGHVAVALSYALGTLVCALGAVWLVDRASTPIERALIRDAEGDE
jgi:CrcB protein